MAKNYRHFLPIHEVLQKDYSNDDEFTSRVSLELCLPENRDAAVKLLAADTRSRCSRVFVEGYNTSLPADEIKLALFKHFSSSCGGVFDVVVPVDPETNLLGRNFVLIATLICIVVAGVGGQFPVSSPTKSPSAPTTSPSKSPIGTSPTVAPAKAPASSPVVTPKTSRLLHQLRHRISGKENQFRYKFVSI
ncbi:hypothetical protein AALP_AA7G252900 [Arabis alpina]|uniref:Uncharacterized protein n=1 Tax=Arabis alpina TaxID=50452 RepID=A0A087GKH3_ARAAL|nr:hypothetical protein AALP_AA7G252900 [Arabis alpina]